MTDDRLDRYPSELLEEFQAAVDQGHLVAAVPYLDVCSGCIGLSVADIPAPPDGMLELARSTVDEDRAAAAIMACTNVARATERSDSTRKCVELTPMHRPRFRIPVRVFLAQATIEQPVSPMAFIRASIGHVTT